MNDCKYLLGLYRKGSPFPEDVVNITLDVVRRSLPDFYPARFQTAPDAYHVTNVPDDFDRSFIPAEYWIEQGISVRIPLTGRNDENLSILDDRDSVDIPSNVLIGWHSYESLPDICHLETLLDELIDNLSPSYSRIVNTQIFDKDEFVERKSCSDESILPAALYWMTWISPSYSKSLGKSLAELQLIFCGMRMKPCKKGGFLLTLTDEPFDEYDEIHLAARDVAESNAGLRAR